MILSKFVQDNLEARSPTSNHDRWLVVGIWSMPWCQRIHVGSMLGADGCQTLNKHCFNVSFLMECREIRVPPCEHHLWQMISDRRQGIMTDLLMQWSDCCLHTVTAICQGERRKFDRFVDLNVRGAQRRGYSDLRIYRNWVISST